MFDLCNKVAMITGAAGGIGQVIAREMAKAGGDVAISDRPGVNLKKTADKCAKYNHKIYKFEMDLTDVDQIKKGISGVLDRFGKVDILVNNAGIVVRTPGLEIDQDIWDLHFNVNVRGSFFCTQAVVGGMIERGSGRIIFISSQSGLIGIAGQQAYCASKGAIINLVRSMAVEWGEYGVTINAIAPTFVKTKLTEKTLKDPQMYDFIIGNIPKGRLAKPEDIAYAVLYLASDEADMVNGAILSVDGGWTAR